MVSNILQIIYIYWSHLIYIETAEAALFNDGNNIKTMGDVLGEGLWSDALMDPETSVVSLVSLTFNKAYLLVVELPVSISP